MLKVSQLSLNYPAIFFTLLLITVWAEAWRYPEPALNWNFSQAGGGNLSSSGRGTRDHV